MDGLALLCRIALIVAFAVAGMAKLGDREGTRQMLSAFGAPSRATRPASLALPLVELAIATMLLLPRTVWLGSIAALVLLMLFTMVIGYNLSRGRKPECRCFGQAGAGPIGVQTLVRNVALTAASTLLVWSGPERANAGLLAGFDRVDSSIQIVAWFGVVCAMLLAAVVWLQVQMLRQQGRMLLRLDDLESRLGTTIEPAPPPQRGLSVGSIAPEFNLPDLNGTRYSLTTLRSAEQAVMLFFVDPHCGPCHALIPELSGWARQLGPGVRLVAISRGDVAENREFLGIHGVLTLLQREFEVADAFHAWGTPAAILVRADGTIGSATAGGADAIRALVDRTVTELGFSTRLQPLPVIGNGNSHASQALPPSLAPGDVAPELSRPDLDGTPRTLEEFSGGPMLLVFWDQQCGFCKAMTRDLQEWDSTRGPGDPALVLISRGTLANHQDLQLSAPVLIDNSGEVSRAYGAHGTPMGILIDAEGRIASELAAGATAVMALARSPGRSH